MELESLYKYSQVSQMNLISCHHTHMIARYAMIAYEHVRKKELRAIQCEGCNVARNARVTKNNKRWQEKCALKESVHACARLVRSWFGLLRIAKWSKISFLIFLLRCFRALGLRHLPRCCSQYHNTFSIFLIACSKVSNWAHMLPRRSDVCDMEDFEDSWDVPLSNTASFDAAWAAVIPVSEDRLVSKANSSFNLQTWSLWLVDILFCGVWA